MLHRYGFYNRCLDVTVRISDTILFVDEEEYSI